MLAPIGRPEATKLDDHLAGYIPLIFLFIESATVAPAEYEIIGETGFDNVLEAYAYHGAGKRENKLETTRCATVWLYFLNSRSSLVAREQ